MDISQFPLPTLILLSGVIFQFCFILSGRPRLIRLGHPAALAFLLAAAALVAHKIWGSEPQQSYFGVLADRPYLRLARLTFLLSTLLVFRSFVGTAAVSKNRLGQISLLVLMVTFWGDVLLLSNSFLLSYVALNSMVMVGALMVGISFRGRLEGESVLKNWNQVSLFVPLGLFCCLLISLLSGGLDLEKIQQSSVAIANPITRYILCALLFFPFLLAGAIFPFHFLSTDRDQGSNWSTQLFFANCIHAPMMVALWSVSYQMQQDNPNWPGAKILLSVGILGCLWQGIYALGQKSAKRMLSALTGAHWSFALIAAAGASQRNLEAAIIGFSSCFMWISALGFIWSRFQESVGSDNLLGAGGIVGGEQKKGLLLLFALAPAFFVPGLSSFPALIHHFSAILEHQSILLLLVCTLFLVLLGLTPLRVLSELLFMPAAAPAQWRRDIRYDALDWGVLTLSLVVMAVIGFTWPTLLLHIAASAKLFH